MRPAIVRTLAVLAMGGVVLIGVLYVASTVDARPPTVTAVRLTQPMPDDDRLAAVTTSIEVVFSEPVDVDSAASAVSLEPAVAGAASWSGSTMTLTPFEPLALDSSFRLVIGPGIRDAAGNVMTDLPAPFEFATIGRPELLSSVPADGETDVALDSSITLTFATLMDTASVEAALGVEPTFDHHLRWNGRALVIVPDAPLIADRSYRVVVETTASDISGVELSEPIVIGFRTVAPGLAVEGVVPADGIDGIAVTSLIAVRFDRPIDPDSLRSNALSIEPTVAGTLRVASAPGEPATADGSGSMLVFTPSGALPPNTTFSVELTTDVTSLGGGRLADGLTWTFTTGVPVEEISNQVTFLSGRSGSVNVWAMNPDGSGQRQVTAELADVVDYVVSPVGDSLVVSDGRRLVHLAADGSGRRILTDSAFIEFDPAFAPEGRRVAFARVDADSGAWLGLWEWEVGGGDPEPIVLPAAIGQSPVPTPDTEPRSTPLRAPRYSPDGLALAFVDVTGSIGMLELPRERLTVVPFEAAAAPMWLPDSSAVLLAGREADAPGEVGRLEPPIGPLIPEGGNVRAYRLHRSGTSVNPSPFGTGATVVAVAVDGTIAYVTADGSLWLTDLPNSAGSEPALAGVRVHAAAFGPGGDVMVVEISGADGRHVVQRFDPASGERSLLATDATVPRWHP